MKSKTQNYFHLAFLFTSLPFTHSASFARDCSESDVCQFLRDAESVEKNISSRNVYSYVDGTVAIRVPEVHANFNLTFLTGGSVRLNVKVIDQEPYQLQHALKGKPETISSLESMNIGDDSLNITQGPLNIVFGYYPLRVEFYNNDELVVVFGGDRLYINNETYHFAFEVFFPQAWRLYGIQGHAESLALKNTSTTDPYRLKNVDVGNYELNTPRSLCGSIPVLYGHGPRVTSGIFLNNAAEQWYDTASSPEGSKAYVMVNTGDLDLFVLPGPTPAEVVRQYVDLTGTAHLPQLWALGYHESRFSYMTQEDVKDVVANFTQNDFPLDAIWLDLDHTDGNRYFTWNPENYTDPIEMQQNISAYNKRLVVTVNPQVKIDNEYSIYSELNSGSFFVKAEGQDFIADGWPGNSSFVDFLNPDASQLYESFYYYENYEGSTPVLAGIWNNQNEPALFNDDFESTLPEYAYHYEQVQNMDIHNIYGLLMTAATHQGLLDRDDGTLRPFVLSRSHFAGIQRYAAIWTGDNTADWGYLALSYAQCLSYNILGVVFCGADIGGFLEDPDEELLQRWYQAAVWLPFFRSNSYKETRRREPYRFGEDVQEVIRNALQQRYQHLPVFYTLFYEHTRYGDPIIRPLFYQYPSESDTFDIENQLLVGTDILVRAVTEPGVGNVEVYFPGRDETWLAISGNETYLGGTFASVSVDIESIPVFYRAGSIIATKQTRRLNTDDLIDDPYTLLLVPDNDGNAYGTVYTDDYSSFDYENNDHYSYLALDFDGSTVTYTQLANFDDFDFNVESVIVLDTIVRAQKGEPGTYIKKTYKSDKNGRLLEGFNAKGKKKLKFDLW